MKSLRPTLLALALLAPMSTPAQNENEINPYNTDPVLLKMNLSELHFRKVAATKHRLDETFQRILRMHAPLHEKQRLLKQLSANRQAAFRSLFTPSQQALYAKLLGSERSLSARAGERAASAKKPG